MPPRSSQRAARLVGGVDPWLLLAFLALVGIGLLMVYSSSIADSYSFSGSPYYYFQREIVWVGLGFAALAVTTRLHYRHWERLALPLFAGSLALLALVLFPHIGHLSNGSRRWFTFPGGLFLEPSELIKLALVIYMASWLTSKGGAIRDFKSGFAPFMAMVGLVAILIVREPDLGTAIVVSTTMLAVLFIAGAELPHMFAALTSAGFAGWVLAQASSYRYERLTVFVDPWKDPSGAGYHIIQVLLALGRGGIFGQGLGNSVQKDILPAPHTDSILAVIGEEWGLIGTVAVLVLFLIVAYRGIRIATNAPDSFSRLLAAGITVWITFQALMNFAVITSSVPFTGVPLPFISYGGSSLIITMAAMGILLNISRHSSEKSLARPTGDNRRRDRRPRVSRPSGHPAPIPVPVRSRLQRLEPPARGTKTGGAKRRVSRASSS